MLYDVLLLNIFMHMKKKKKIYVAKNHMKQCSPSLVIREKEVTIKMKYHLAPARMLLSKTKINAGRDSKMAARGRKQKVSLL
jgi:hypothetical protein